MTEKEKGREERERESERGHINFTYQLERSVSFLYPVLALPLPTALSERAGGRAHALTRERASALLRVYPQKLK